ncbi:MAG TPA: MBL fold metallo-hydrolase [Candidatus Angelobacter sp.]|nr:MBL fold metallo-hydrolase [Candidatus Angelobacter sp.]
MIHEIFPVGPLACNCSVIGDEQSREAMVVDPGDEIERVLDILKRHRLDLKMIVVTHGHIDHIGGAGKLHAATSAPVMMNSEDNAQIKLLPLQAMWVGMHAPGALKIDQPLRDGDGLKIGAVTAGIMHTPGHTAGSVCLYLPAEKKLIAGDTLFAGSIGRTDLPGGSMEKLMRSLHQKVMHLPDETVVVPGHGPLTTIAEERNSNPFLVSEA